MRLRSLSGKSKTDCDFFEGSEIFADAGPGPFPEFRASFAMRCPEIQGASPAGLACNYGVARGASRRAAVASAGLGGRGTKSKASRLWLCMAAQQDIGPRDAANVGSERNKPADRCRAPLLRHEPERVGRSGTMCPERRHAEVLNEAARHHSEAMGSFAFRLLGLGL